MIRLNLKEELCKL